jgi:AcrR family transcriptional regulator
MTRKEEIFLTSIKLMKAKGYVGTSMRDIASSMSIEAASLYNHIRNKEDILRENCFNLAARFIDSLNEVLSSGEDSETKLKHFIRNHIEILVDDLEASHVFLHEWKHLSEPHYGRFLSMRDEYERGLKKILKDDEQNNSFENRMYRMVVISVLASLNATEQWYNKDGEMDINELCDHLTNILVKGIKEKI